MVYHTLPPQEMMKTHAKEAKFFYQKENLHNLDI